MQRLLNKHVSLSRNRWRTLAVSLLILGLASYTSGQPQRILAQFTPGDLVQILGFNVELEPNNGGGGGGVDSYWQTLTGGALQLEIIESSVGQDQFHSFEPSRSSITDLELRGPVVSSAGSGIDAIELHQGGAGKFSVEIDTLPNLSSVIKSISIDPLQIIPVETSTSSDIQARTYAPSAVKYGQIAIEFRRTSDPSGLLEWWQDFAQGDSNAGKNVTLKALRRDGSVGRQWVFHDAVPVRYSPNGSGYGPDNVIATESVILEYGIVEFAGIGGVRSFMEQQLNDIVNEIPILINLAVTEVDPSGQEIRTLNYLNAFPTRYVFPGFDAEDDSGVFEEIHYRVNIVEIQ